MEDKRSCREAVAVILPSLNPDAKFSRVVDGLVEDGFQHIIIVDDGSDAEHQLWFDRAAGHPQCTVLHHGVNKGKGRALKTAFAHVAEKLPELKGVITIDGDGQHLLEDIIACGEKMLALGDAVVLGCRDFDAPGVPPRSVAGNKSTNRMFKLFFGINMLLQMKKQNIVFLEQPIATVYDPEDYSSHYNAVKDSWRIFKIMMKNKFR